MQAGAGRRRMPRPDSEAGSLMSLATGLQSFGRRRASSLFLLVFALLVSVSAFAQVGLARDGRLPTGMFGYGAAITLLAGVAYFVVARWAPYADPLLVPLAVFLNGLGLAIIYRIDQKTTPTFLQDKQAWEQAHPGQHYVPFGSGANASTQLMWTTVSIAIFIAFVLIVKDVKILQRYHYTLGAFGLFFLVLPIFFPPINGARVWITLPGLGSIQPAEFSKFALVAFFSGYLVKKGPSLSLIGRKVGPLELPRGRDLAPIIVFWLVSIMILVAQNDFGFQLLFFGLLIAMLYIGTGRPGWVVVGLTLFIVGSLSVYFIGSAMHGGILAHLIQRVDTWLNPQPYFDGGCQLGGQIFNRDVDPSGFGRCMQAHGQYADSSQLMQGLFGMGTGGVLGTGLGQGHPFITPLAFSDEIATSLGEELGLTGMMAILLVYVLLIQRGFKTAITVRDGFSKLFAGGISFVFALQVFVIVGGVTRLIPFAGLTTPFMAQGGSSLLANWILIAILVRLSDQGRRPAPQAIQDEGMTQIVSLK